MPKQRLDILLVEKGFSSSRQQAQRLIQAGEVLVNDTVVDKAGTSVDVAAAIRIKQKSRFVSRGGEKLTKALDNFDIGVEGRVCLDGGISTGGFTDCLLQAGAKLVYGIDVGYGQLDWRLRNDPRVIVRERTNLRHLTPEDLYGHFSAYRADDAQTKAVMQHHAQRSNVTLDPHSAVGVYAVEQARQRAGIEDDTLYVTLATAHPAKFPDAVHEATGDNPALPPHLADLYDKVERSTDMPAQTDAIAEYLLAL
ncbi:MAG: TlyA family rRNA (cytidine-2'-O)-methyltransferase [Cyanobacteria bacterium P01_D01_bin.116]